MMEQEKKYLSDIPLAIDLIEQFTESINDYDTFLADLKTQSAVERQLGIIGEAINKYGKITTAGPIENAVKNRYNNRHNSARMMHSEKT